MGKPCRRLIKFKPRFSLNVVHLTKGGGHWDFRFCGFGYLLGRFFRFLCRKTSVFRFGVHSGWRILRFKRLVFNIHKKKHQWVFGFGIRCGVRFLLFRFRLLLDL